MKSKAKAEQAARRGQGQEIVQDLQALYDEIEQVAKADHASPLFYEAMPGVGGGFIFMFAGDIIRMDSIATMIVGGFGGRPYLGPTGQIHENLGLVKFELRGVAAHELNYILPRPLISPFCTAIRWAMEPTSELKPGWLDRGPDPSGRPPAWLDRWRKTMMDQRVN